MNKATNSQIRAGIRLHLRRHAVQVFVNIRGRFAQFANFRWQSS